MGKAIHTKGSVGKQNRKIILFRIGTFILAGIAAVMVDSEYDYASLLSFRQFPYSAGYFLVLCMLTVLTAWLMAFNNHTSREYPALKYNNWRSSHYLLNFISWTLYLFSYEYMLRGVYLYFLLLHFSITVSILLNVALYALLHATKSRKEFLLSIPYGILLCMVVLQSHSFYTAFILHLLFALNYEGACLRFSHLQQHKTA